MIQYLSVDSLPGSGQVHFSRNQSMALSTPQFNEPHDELWYKWMSQDLVLVSTSHNVLVAKIDQVNKEVTVSITELKREVSNLSNQLTEFKIQVTEKDAETEKDQLITEKDLYQLRQKMNRVEATLDARGLSL